MERFELDAEAGQVSDADELPMAAIAQEGGAFDRLADEPELYSDADLLLRR